MPSLAIDDKVKFFYLDSGAPAVQSEDYTTLVFVHGFLFNAYTFEPLLKYSAKYGVRIIAISRRDYPTTTAFETADVAPIATGSDPEAGLKAIRARGLELALFLSKFAKECNLGKKGFILLGWSLGNATTLSLLAFLDSYPPDVKADIVKYLKHFVLYDPPPPALGFSTPPAPEMYALDTSLTPEQKVEAFMPFATGYYNHDNPSLSEEGLDGLSFHPSSHRVPTWNSMSPEEKSTILTPANASGGGWDIVFIDEGPFISALQLEVTKRALMSVEGQILEIPGLPVTLFYGTEDAWNVIYLGRKLAKMVAEKKGRSIKFAVLQGFNHFPHRDDSDKFLAELRGLLSF